MNTLTDDQLIDKVLKETGLKLIELENGTTTKDIIMSVAALRYAFNIIKDLESVCGDENHKWDGSLDCPCMICDCSRRTALLFQHLTN